MKQYIIYAGILLTLTIGLIFFIEPAEGLSPVILSHRSYLDSIGSYWILGEFQNQESKPIRVERVTATFYDSSNTVITVLDWTVCMRILPPNQKSPFTILLNNSTIVPKVDHYSVEITSSYTSVVPLDLRIGPVTSNVSSIETMDFYGEVENAGTETADSTEVHLTCYGSDGKVVSSFTSLVEPNSDIPPGQKASFRISTFPGMASQVESYTLVADSYIPEPFSPVQPPPDSTSPDQGNASLPSQLLAVAWVPPPQNAAVATAATVVAVAVVSVVVAAATTPVGTSAGGAVDKLHNLLPEGAKKWLEEFISSRRKPSVVQEKRSPFLPTKAEALAYGVSLVVLTISFSYVKAPSIGLIFEVLPTILATAVIVELIKTYALEVFARSRGLWTEHRIWYVGLAMFLVTTFTFGIPFSSPSRNVYHAPGLTKRLNGIVASVAVLVTLAFAGFFFLLLASGLTLIGSTGLAMCVIMGFIDTLPVEPMNGKAIFNHKKALWAAMFAVTLAVYVAWLLLV